MDVSKDNLHEDSLNLFVGLVCECLRQDRRFDGIITSIGITHLATEIINLIQSGEVKLVCVKNDMNENILLSIEPAGDKPPPTSTFSQDEIRGALASIVPKLHN